MGSDLSTVSAAAACLHTSTGDSVPSPSSAAEFGRNFTLGKKIGVGATAEVRLCTHNATGQQMAAKIVPKALFAKQPRLQERLTKEVAIMREGDHPNILKLLGCHETEDSIVLLLELASGGELFDYLIRRGRLGEAEARHVFKQLISAVKYCHDRNVCHRDIKPENVLLGQPAAGGGPAATTIKLADFGFATHMHAVSDGTENWAETSCGSPHYASPEVIRGERYQGPQADIWSCGVMLFALLTGGLPFDGESIPQLLRAVKVGRFSIPKWVDPRAQDLLRSMMRLNPADRVSIAAIEAHPWVATGSDQTLAGAPSASSHGGASCPAIRQVGRFAVSVPPAPPRACSANAEEFSGANMSCMSLGSAGSSNDLVAGAC